MQAPSLQDPRTISPISHYPPYSISPPYPNTPLTSAPFTNAENTTLYRQAPTFSPYHTKMLGLPQKHRCDKRRQCRTQPLFLRTRPKEPPNAPRPHKENQTKSLQSALQCYQPPKKTKDKSPKDVKHPPLEELSLRYPTPLQYFITHHKENAGRPIKCHSP